MWLSRRGFDSHPPDHLATAAGMASDSQRSDWVRERRKVSQGVRLAVSRQSLKLASGVRLAHPLPIGRWRNLAARCALNAEVSGSIPERPAKCLCGYRSGDRIERYERSDRGSSPRTRTIRPSSNGQGAALRMPRFRFDPGWLDQVFMGASGSDAEVM